MTVLAALAQIAGLALLAAAATLAAGTAAGLAVAGVELLLVGIALGRDTGGRA